MVPAAFAEKHPDVVQVVLTVYLDAALALIEEAPDDSHIVANLPEDLPWLVGDGVHVSAAFAEEHPQAVQDFVTTYIRVVA